MSTNITTLLYDPLRGFRTWHISEIYLGPSSTGDGRVVPNVKDAVFDWSAGIFQVVAVETEGNDPSYTPTLVLVDFNILMNQSKGLGMELYQPSILELAFVNAAVTPNTISIDDRYRAYGTEAAYAKLFKGTDLSNTGVIISQTYNGSGNFVSENVELELIDPTNPAIKRPPVFNTNTALFDGEVVTLVLYTQAGGVTGTHPFLVKNTDAIRGLAASTVFITDIKLVTNLLDPVLIDTINVPANIPVSGGDFQARLLYSDGSSALISVGSAKCKLYGIENFNTAISGPGSEVVLTYYPDVNEPTINVSNPATRSISHVYNIRTVENVLDYSFKIYVVPHFNALSQTYTNEYYLTNLAYNLLVKLAPNQITVSKSGGGVIDYSVNADAQTLILSVLMSNVIPFGYSGYTFVQAVTINYGTESGVGWILDYLNNNTYVYGAQAYFEYSTQGQQAISIQSGALSIEEWIARLYTSLHPIYDQAATLTAPVPTHFQLSYNGQLSPIRAIADYWDLLLPNDFDGNWVNYSTVTVIWLLPTVDVTVYKKLGVSAVRIKNTLT